MDQNKIPETNYFQVCDMTCETNYSDGQDHWLTINLST